MVDFLIVGAGLYGSVCARVLADKGYKVRVIESRDHIGGNCYTFKEGGIDVHKYGAHIFHTSDEEVWSFVNKYISFYTYFHRPVVDYNSKMYSLPINLWTYYELYGCRTPKEALKYFNPNAEGANLREYGINLLGEKVYNTFIKEYSEKQWGRKDRDIPSSVLKRLPIELNYNTSYFKDKYVGIPTNGYTELFNKLLRGIDVELSTDFFNLKELHYKNLIYTGPIDRYFKYKYGKLEYKSCIFDHTILEEENYQGAAVVNYTSINVPYTRVIEHKHFTGVKSKQTVITKEYPNSGDLLLYPVSDKNNKEILSKYLKESSYIKNVHIGGRLGGYQYIDMDKTIRLAFDFVSRYL